MRVLAIDDNRAALHNLARLLKKLGHTVWEALSGEEALQCVEHTHFDLIVVDYYLGDMNAVDFLHRLREPVPVILASGDPHHQDLFYAVLEKPYGIEELSEAIRKVLG